MKFELEWVDFPKNVANLSPELLIDRMSIEELENSTQKPQQRKKDTKAK